MAKQQPKWRGRKPIMIRADLHAALMAEKKETKRTLEGLIDEVMETGLRVKQIAIPKEA